MTTMKYSRLLDKMKIRGSEPHNIGLKVPLAIYLTKNKNPIV